MQNLRSKLGKLFIKYPFLRLTLPIVISLVLLFTVFKLVGVGSGSNQDETFDQSEAIDITSLEVKNRPYVGLVPRADGHALILTVTNHQEFSDLNFEILYLAGNLQQGSIGQIDMAKSAYKTEITLGACSKGVCRYDDNVHTGSLKLTGTRDGKSYQAEISFVLDKITPEAKNIVGPENTLDFSIQPGSVSSDYYVLISQTLGLPIPLPNTKGNPVAVFTIAPKLNKAVSVSLKNQNMVGLKLNRFDFSENKWTSGDTKVEDGSKFSSDRLGLFAFTQ